MRLLKHKNNKSSGQALVEVLVAISVLTVGFLAVVTLLSRALSLNRVVADNYTATYLAAEGIEITKNILDANILNSRPWNSGFTNGSFEVDTRSATLEPFRGRSLRFNPATRIYGYSGPVATTFERRITVSLVGGNQVNVRSSVDWQTRGGGSFSVDLEDNFFNWRP